MKLHLNLLLIFSLLCGSAYGALSDLGERLNSAKRTHKEITKDIQDIINKLLEDYSFLHEEDKFLAAELIKRQLFALSNEEDIYRVINMIYLKHSEYPFISHILYKYKNKKDELDKYYFVYRVLFIAAKKGDISMIKYLLKTYEVNINTFNSNKIDFIGNIFHIACYFGQLNLVEWLVENCHRLDFKAIGEIGATPLELAYLTNNLNIVKYLVEDAQIYNNQDVEQSLLISCYYNLLWRVKYLISFYQNNSDICFNQQFKLYLKQCFILSCQKEYTEVVVMLYEKFNYVTDIEPSIKINDYGFVQYFCNDNYLEILKALDLSCAPLITLYIIFQHAVLTKELKTSEYFIEKICTLDHIKRCCSVIILNNNLDGLNFIMNVIIGIRKNSCDKFIIDKMQIILDFIQQELGKNYKR